MWKLQFAKPSNNIDSAYYDNSTRTLLVRFKNGQWYQHYTVPLEAVQNWEKYRSPGEFYHLVMKRYPYKGLTGEEVKQFKLEARKREEENQSNGG